MYFTEGCCSIYLALSYFLESSEQCDLDGLLCLNNNYLQLSLKKSQGSLQGGSDCYCEPNCDDIELQRIDGEITT